MAQVRISDVATAAGVSTATVSLVLNGRQARISEATRERVQQAARDVGYVPNTVARSLRTQQTRTIGLISDVIATTPFAGRMLAGAHDAARENGYLLFLVNTDGDAEIEHEAIEALKAHQVDALVYAAMWHRIITPPTSLPATTVLLDCRAEDDTLPAVIPDDYAGGVLAAQELVDSGHRKIAFLDAEETERPVAATLRFAGYQDVLAQAHIAHNPLWHIRGHATTAHGGREATEELLRLPLDQWPTAIMCFNDRMAAGAYTALRQRGLRIPDDMSVVGYDNQALVASELDPPLTTVALPHYEMGRYAIEIAVGAREKPAPHQPITVPCPIIRRDSVSLPRATVTRSISRQA